MLILNNGENINMNNNLNKRKNATETFKISAASFVNKCKVELHLLKIVTILNSIRILVKKFRNVNSICIKKYAELSITI